MGKPPVTMARVLEALSKKPYRTVQELADDIGANRPNCQRIVSNLVKNGVISHGYRLNRPPLAYCLVGKPRRPASNRTIEVVLREAACVSSFHGVTSGDYNYIAYIGVSVDSAEFGTFLAKLESCASQTTTLVRTAAMRPGTSKRPRSQNIAAP